MFDKSKETISVNNISKKFQIGCRKNDSFLSRLLFFISWRESERTLKVLENISFKAYAGEKIGIIGKNGSGKSTLLKIISGIYQSDDGNIKTNGNLLYIDGYGLGLKQKLTMRDNIFLIGTLMGLNKKEINTKLSDILAFSELEDFIDTKVYKFSSGMLNRLSFSITINCLECENPDIILLDEVFGSSGDISFQEKAIARMEKFINNGSTVIMVSHDLNIVKKYCQRAILIHDNKKNFEGDPEEVIEKYKKLLNLPNSF